MNKPVVNDHMSVSCGMYAFTEPLQQAWAALFSPLTAVLQDIDPHHAPRSIAVHFDTSDTACSADDLLLAQTCGYPYLKRWQSSHQLVAVPVFSIDGCRGSEYSSWFICRQDDQRSTLAQFASATCAVNSPLSNSGMNVLRFALKDLASNGRFFSEVNITGSHQSSILAVARGDADIAAIDAVSWHYYLNSAPDVASKVHIFGQSAYCQSLPFMCLRNSRMSADTLCAAINHCVERIDPGTGSTLQLSHFERAEQHRYLPIMEMEAAAIDAGYAELN